MTALPRVTLAFLSWNRLHYLRATLESARECIRYPDLEWIVSDNESDEPGLRDYLESCDWLDRRLYRRQSHAEAMNEIVATASGEVLLLWPEDVQFTVRGDWMADLAELLMANRWIGSICLDHMRRATLQSIFEPSSLVHWKRIVREFRRFGTHFRRQQTVASARGAKLRTFGWVLPGICGSGIPSLTRTEVWRALGPWRTRPAGAALADSSLGAEEDMIGRFFEAGLPLQGATPLVPVAADIVTDPTGCKAKVRGRYRYGVYMPPPEGRFYYRIRDAAAIEEPGEIPVDFARGVDPLGFTVPVDERGDRLKSALNMSVVYDLERRRQVPYPLAPDLKPPTAPRDPTA
jgi:glycosyltransferase involved in cell wall biosynthesis